jgi:hypothetical protein
MVRKCFVKNTSVVVNRKLEPVVVGKTKDNQRDLRGPDRG